MYSIVSYYIVQVTDVQDQLDEVYRGLVELNNIIEQHVIIAIQYVTLCTLLCHIVPYCVLCCVMFSLIVYSYSSVLYVVQS